MATEPQTIMPDGAQEMRELLKAQLAAIDDPARRALLETYLVWPQPLILKWGYGKPGERYTCWLVASHRNTRIVYCDQGFGPAYPWGIVGPSDDWMGMDCHWHVGL